MLTAEAELKFTQLTMCLRLRCNVQTCATGCSDSNVPAQSKLTWTRLDEQQHNNVRRVSLAEWMRCCQFGVHGEPATAALKNAVEGPERTSRVEV